MNNLKELYQLMGFHPNHYSRWIRMNLIDKTDIIDGEDYEIKYSITGKTKQVFVSEDFVTDYLMKSNTPQGRTFRKQFIKRLKFNNEVIKKFQEIINLKQIENSY